MTFIKQSGFIISFNLFSTLDPGLGSGYEWTITSQRSHFVQCMYLTEQTEPYWTDVPN